MKIKYLQLKGKLNIPGMSGSQLNAGSKVTANGLDGAYNGACKTIVQTRGGYILHVAGGQHRGFYHVPDSNVDHAGVEYTFWEQYADLGILSNTEYEKICEQSKLSDPELFEAGVSRERITQIRAEFGEPLTATDDGEKQPQTEPEAATA